MPELPEVETVRRGLEPVLTGHRLSAVTLRRSTLRRPIPEDFVQRLTGSRVETVGRRAKYLVLGLDSGWAVLWHLGMSGSVRIFTDGPPPPGRHDHLDLVSLGGATVRFTDPRRFGSLDLAAPGRLADHPLLRDLGPEPLGNDFNAETLCSALRGRRSPVKSALLDQKTVAGLGNIYVCEALYRAGLSPRRQAYTIGPKRSEKLVFTIRAVLNEAIAAGGSTLRDHRLTDGTLGYFSHRFGVYDREAKPCPDCDCGAERGVAGKGVKRIIQAGRSTFYCPNRQR